MLVPETNRWDGLNGLGRGGSSLPHPQDRIQTFPKETHRTVSGLGATLSPSQLGFVGPSFLSMECTQPSGMFGEEAGSKGGQGYSEVVPDTAFCLHGDWPGWGLVWAGMISASGWTLLLLGDTGDIAPPFRTM